MLASDYIVDVGPGAGIHGGEIIACGTPEEIMESPRSITGAYLSGRRKVPVPAARRKPTGYITAVSYTHLDVYKRQALGGLHATSLPREAARHADSVLTGLGEWTFPAFLADLRRGEAQPLYRAGQVCLARAPLPRRDLIKREKYLVPNSMLISRGCPNACDFCYVDSFFRGGRRFYTYPLERVLREMDSLPGKHIYFLDDNLLADRPLSEALFQEMRGMGLSLIHI